MALKDVVLKATPTSYTVTGGTQASLGTLSSNGDKTVLYATADTDIRTRRTIDCSRKVAKVLASAPNGYSQPRELALFRFPRILANGKLTVDTISIQLSTDIETSEANRIVMLDFAAQFLIDANARAFLLNQATA